MATATIEVPATATAQLMTADEFWDFCQLSENENRRFELICGEVIEMPNPTRKHGRVCLRIGYEFETYTERVRWGYGASNDSGTVLAEDPDTVVGPDVAYYDDSKTFAAIHPKWGTKVPVLAVEVLSPSDRRRVVLEKVSDYLSSGVKAVWLADYEESFVTVFRTTAAPKIFGGKDTLTGDDYLPGFTCSVAKLFLIPGETADAPSA